MDQVIFKARTQYYIDRFKCTEIPKSSELNAYYGKQFQRDVTMSGGYNKLRKGLKFVYKYQRKSKIDVDNIPRENLYALVACICNESLSVDRSLAFLEIKPGYKESDLDVRHGLVERID